MNKQVKKVNKVVVFGLGAAGSNVLLHLAYAHPDLSFVGVDFDIVEQRNFEAGTQPYSKADLNRPKVQAMQRILQSSRKIMAGHVTRILSAKQISDIAGDPADALLIDAFDNAESRNLFLPLAKTHHIMHVGFSATLTGEAVWAESYSEMTPDSKGNFDVCQAHVARPFIHALTAIAALLATEFIDSGKKRNTYFDSKLKTFNF